MSKLLKKILIFLVSGTLIFFITIISILWTYSNELPDYKFLKMYKPPVSSKLYSGGGELVSDFSSEKRIFVPYEAIPKIVINAFLSAEDKNFFSHPGVDAKGIARAIIKNISNIIYENKLPKNFIKYIKYLEEKLKVPIAIISVGPDRKQTIIRENFKTNF